MLAWVDRFSVLIENSSSSRFYPLRLSLLLMFLSLLFATPKFTAFNPSSYAWQTVALKSSDLTNQLNHIDPHSWLSKKVFRLTVPINMRISHLPPLGILILQYLLGIGLLVLCYKLSIRILNDAVNAT